MSGVERRLKRLEDRAELQDLVVRYFVAVDGDDYTALSEILSSGMSFAASGFPGGSGRESVVNALKSARNAMGATVHTHDYTLLDIQDDGHATGLVGAHLELAIGNQTVYAAVRYVDEYIREAGSWHIHRREMKVIHAGPWGDVGSSLTAERPVRWPGMEALPSDMPRRA